MRGYIAVLLALLSFCGPIEAYDVSPPCVYQIGSYFFDKTALFQALSMHRIDQGTWNPIYTDLRRNVLELRKNVQQKAKNLKPNPLYRPYNPEKAQELVMQALFEIFSYTLAEYQITDPGNIQEMFEYIRSESASKIEACFASIKKKSVNNQ